MTNYPFELVTCSTPGCNTRTLPRIAAADWPEGKCDLCQDPDLREFLRAPGSAPAQSLAQIELESAGTAEKRKLRFAELHPEPEEKVLDPNQTSLWSSDPLLTRKAA